MEIQYMATLDGTKRDERLQELRSSGIRKKANKLVALLNSAPVFAAVEKLVQRGAHFLEMPELNVSWLHQKLCGTQGGVSLVLASDTPTDPNIAFVCRN